MCTMQYRKIVIIPTYNEKENIEKMIRKVRSLEGDFHILVVDDGSPDGTGGIVKGLQTEFQESLFILGTRHSLQGRIQMVSRTRLRLYIRDGC